MTDSPKYGEADLQAWVDGGLDAETRANIDAWLAENPDVARRLEAYARQNAALHEAFDPVLDEPVPARLLTAATGRATAPAGIWSVWRIAAAIGFLAIGGLSGWIARDQWPRANDSQIAEYAFNAHTVYVAEKRHAVEVQAAEEKHLVSWLSKRLGTSLKIPHLAAQGYSLVGGRLLSSERGPAAQFMYQDLKGQRLTLYVRVSGDAREQTAFRFTQENRVGVFYWLDGRIGYALSGETDRSELLRVAEAVYRQLNP